MDAPAQIYNVDKTGLAYEHRLQKVVTLKGQKQDYFNRIRQTSRLTIVSREAKKKQAVRDERVSYLHVALV